MARNQSFRFKQFCINQDRCAMKVGTDGVLLGCWTEVGSPGRMLDIGCGTGLIALMLAQKAANRASVVGSAVGSSAGPLITGIEVDPDAAGQAAQNVAESPWPGSVSILNVSLQDYRPLAKFDLMVSNPPFFSEDVVAPLAKRHLARNCQSLPREALASFAANYLTDDGRLCVILPYAEALKFVSICQDYGLWVQRETRVCTRVNQEPKRSLLQFVRRQCQRSVNSLSLMYEAGDELTTEYRSLASDFYLKC